MISSIVTALIRAAATQYMHHLALNVDAKCFNDPSPGMLAAMALRYIR